MAKVAVGADYVYTFAKETTFGTAVAANMTTIPTEGFTINHDYKTHQVNRAWGKRNISEDGVWQDTNGSIPEATFSFFASPQTLQLIPAAFQKPTAWNTGTAVSSVSGYVDYTNLPDFSANEGYFYTIQAQGPAQAYNERLVSAIGKSIKFSFGPDANEGAMMIELGVVAKSSGTNVANRTGTDVNSSISALYKWSELDAFSINSVSFLTSLYDFEFTYNNNAKPIPYGGGANMTLPKIEGNGSFKLLASDAANLTTIKGLVASNASNAAIPIQLYWGSATPATIGDLVMNMNVYLTNYSVDRSLDGEETVTFEYVLCTDSAGTPTPFNMTWKN